MEIKNPSGVRFPKETWLASFPENNPNPILEISLDGRIEYFNPAIRELFPALLEQQSNHPYLANWEAIANQCRSQPELILNREVRVGEEYFQQSIHFVKEYQRLRVYGMNITKRKRLEVEVQESEKRYRELVFYAPAGIYEVDFRTQKFLSVNEAICLYTGYSREELMAIGPMKLLDEPSQQLFRQRIQKWLAGEPPEKNVEFRVLAKDGREIFTELEVTFTKDEQGRPKGATVIGHNITERKQAEERLRFQAKVLDTVHDAIIAVDANQRVISWNQGAERLYGWTDAEASGQVLGTFLRSETTPNDWAEGLRQLNETGSLLVEEVAQFTKDSKRIIVECNVIPIRESNGAFNGYVTANRDITEHKQAETLDKALNRIHRTIHSHLNFDQIMQRSLNEAAKALECDSAGISLRQGLEWVPTFVYHMPPEIIKSKMNDEEEKHAVFAIQTKQPVAVEDAFNDERFNREHLEKWGIRSVLVVPILLKTRTIGVIFFNYTQAIHHFQEMHLDFGRQLAASISLALENTRLIENLQSELNERKKAESALEQANAHLEQRVQERTAEIERSASDLEHLTIDLKRTAAELKTANIELEAAQDKLMSQNKELEKALETEKSLQNQLIQAEKYAALSRLLASVAHEINNPLQTVKNILYLLTPEISSGESKEMLDVAIYETLRIGALVRQLHETYQPHNHEPVEFDLMEVLTRVFTLLGPQLKQNNVQWKLHMEQEGITIHGIPDQIQQVCMNICLNAIDAIGPKGGQLTVEVFQPEKERFCISFQDTGPGILEIDQPHIFEPFFTTKEKGLGLGLPICYEIVKGHGGEIIVESEPGKGTKFTVCLPIQYP